MEAIGSAALSELVDGLREVEGKRITKREFEATLRQYLNGSHASQQIDQLWNKMCREGATTIGRGEVCSFLLREMQQRESQARAHLTLPLPHHPSFSNMLSSKETVCALLSLPSPPQYMTVSKDGCVGIWSTRFQLQQTISIGNRQSGRRLAVATTAREITFHDTGSFSCLHRLHKLPYVPLCLAYGSVGEEERGYLVWGDEKGCVGILSFSQPNKSLFRSGLVAFSCMSEHAPLVMLRYQSVHSDWVTQVGWTGPTHCIISAAQSSFPSLLIQHVWARRKQYAFRVRMGVSCFAYSHRLEVVATGSLDHMVRIWTPFSPQQPVACLASHSAGIVGIAIDEQSYYLFSLAQDISLCVWDLKEHHLLQTISVKFPFTQRQPDFGPSPLSLLPLPSPSLTISCNDYMAKFPLSRSAAVGVRVDTGHTHPVCAVIYVPHLEQLVSACEGGEVRVWDTSTGRCCMKVDGCHGSQELTALAVDSGGSRILTGSRDGAVKVWESLTGQCLQSLGTSGNTEVVSILHNHERRRFIVTGWNKRISVFEEKTHGLSPEPAWSGGTPHRDDIITMDYCPPSYLVTGSFEGLTVVWNTDTERVVSQFHSSVKMRHLMLCTSSSTHWSSRNTPSRPSSSRRLSSYHLKSASSSHLRHVPVDQVLFLKVRVMSKVRGQGTVVTSEGGYAHFWDMFSSGPSLGRLPLATEEGEVALALATDESCQWLVAGDTAGHISIFNIEQFCTNPHSGVMDEMEEADVRWQGHSSEILDVVWTGPGFVVSASADHSVRMWTTEGHCVGWFGQPQLWSCADPVTFHHLPPSRSPGVDERQQERVCEEASATEEQELEVELDTVDTPTEAGRDKSLGRGYQTGVMRRMAERLHRRTVFSDVKASMLSSAQFSPFQNLHVLDIGDVEIPKDVSAALNT